MTFNSSFYLPDESFFTRLVWIASQHDGDILNDRDRGVKVDYATFLRDIQAFRQKIRDTLPRDLLDSNGMVSQEGVYICLLVSASYEFLLAVFAVASLGAAVGLMPSIASPEQVQHILKLCSAPCLLTGPGKEALAAKIQDHAQHHGNQAVQILPITRSSGDQTFPSANGLVRPGLGFADTRPGLLQFTSGTTSAPKGVIHTRRYLYSLAQLRPLVGAGEVHLCLGNTSWTSNFHQLVSSFLRGVRVEIQDSGNRMDLIWGRLRAREITTVCFSVPAWWALMKYFKEEICRLPQDEVQEYVRGVQHLRNPQCSGGMPSPVLKRFWQDLLGGRPLLIAFGSTETGLSFLASPQESSRPEANIGTPAPNVIAKLSGGDHGELLVKKDTLFSGYLGNEAPDVLDEEGFFRTGDVAHRDGESFILDGRQKIDFIKVHDYYVPIRVVEDELLNLPYVDEGYILSVPDDEHSNRVAALVRLRPGGIQNRDHNGGSGYEYHDVGSKIHLTLDILRRDLSATVPASHLPTLFRALADGEEACRTWTGKVAVHQTIQKYFRPSGFHIPLMGALVEVWNS